MNASLVQVALVLIASVAFTGCSGGSGGPSSHVAVTPESPADNTNKPFSGTKFEAKPINYSLISDAHLRQCVRQSGAIDTSPQALSCSGKSIRSLAGIEQFDDLRVLDLSANQIEHIDELRSLSRLSTLNISFNKIYSLEALTNAEYLTKIIANNNNLSSLEELSELPNLKNLYVSNNQIRDLAALNDFGSLEYLTAENNQANIASIPSALPQSLKSYRL